MSPAQNANYDTDTGFTCSQCFSFTEPTRQSAGKKVHVFASGKYSRDQQLPSDHWPVQIRLKETGRTKTIEYFSYNHRSAGTAFRRTCQELMIDDKTIE
jgi:hypothetical protein